MRDNLKEQVMGPAIELAARVKATLERDPEACLVEMEWGNFYVSRITLSCFDGDGTEIVGYLVPDEGAGDTFDFYTPERTS